jgi:hypothetical protein
MPESARASEYEATLRRKEAQFDEVPGEDQADAVRDAFLLGAGPQATGLSSALAAADGATQARVVSRLQQEQGNAYVQRVLAEVHGTPGSLVGISQDEMVDEVMQRKGAGSQLPDSTRTQMEPFFGADLGDVRVHTDARAGELTRELNAEAFTVGNDVFFSDGKYSPDSTEGRATLAHELTHVGQQTGFDGPSVQRQEEEELAPQSTMPEEEEEPAG